MSTTTNPVFTIVEDLGDDRRLCKPREGDLRGFPTRCVIHNYLREAYPWARQISVGTSTIRIHDYRCAHNPEGKVGKCDQCTGRRLEWATPLPAAEAIRAFDRGEDPIFPAFELRESEAVVVPAGQDKLKKRESMKKYREEVKNGQRKPNHKSAKALARARSNRRKG